MHIARLPKARNLNFQKSKTGLFLTLPSMLDYYQQIRGQALIDTHAIKKLCDTPDLKMIKISRQKFLFEMQSHRKNSINRLWGKKNPISQNYGRKF
jgi:hypothetical protein